MTKTKRPKRADGEATRARLLESAGELFAEQGYAETTGKAIAARANADIASINYHFGNRDGLYRAVLVEAHRHFVRLETLDEIAAMNIPASEKLRELIAMILTNFGGSQHWSARVLMRELVSPSSNFEVLRREELPPKLTVALGIISEITGIPSGDPALFYCFLSTAAPCAVLVLSGTVQLAQDRPQLPVQDLIDHLHRFTLAGLQAAAKVSRNNVDITFQKDV